MKVFNEMLAMKLGVAVCINQDLACRPAPSARPIAGRYTAAVEANMNFAPAGAEFSALTVPATLMLTDAPGASSQAGIKNEPPRDDRSLRVRPQHHSSDCVGIANIAAMQSECIP